MSAFTSKSTGNWSSGGQTTWNEPGTPTVLDTVTINSPDTVTVDINEQIGDGTDNVVTVLSGATLAVADGVVLQVYGTIDDQGAITMGDGSAIEFFTPGTTYQESFDLSATPGIDFSASATFQESLTLSATPSIDFGGQFTFSEVLAFNVTPGIDFVLGGLAPVPPSPPAPPTSCEAPPTPGYTPPALFLNEPSEGTGS